MALTETPICNFGENAKEFSLLSTDNVTLSLNNLRGEKGTLIMFICNHCPYVKKVIDKIVTDANHLNKIGIKSVAIMSNDTKNYPEDSFDNMINFSKKNKFPFPYLFDKTHEVAKKYGSVCTPDFFGYNNKLELQYRGRVEELRKAMEQIADSGNGPQKQIPSMGCNIKWFK